MLQAFKTNQMNKVWYHVLMNGKAFGFAVQKLERTGEWLIVDHPDWNFKNTLVKHYKPFLEKNNAIIVCIKPTI